MHHNRRRREEKVPLVRSMLDYIFRSGASGWVILIARIDLFHVRI